MDLDAKENLWLVEQLNACRCCFEQFDHNEKLVEMTEIIKEQFLEFTHLEVQLKKLTYVLYILNI